MSRFGLGPVVLCVALHACAKTHQAATLGEPSVRAPVDGTVVRTPDARRAGQTISLDGSAGTQVGAQDAMGAPPVGDASARTAFADAGGAAGISGSDAATNQRPTRLTLDFSTVTQRGKYAPHNVGVVWVEDGHSQWVHTLEIWVSENYVSVLKKYLGAGGPNYSAAGPLNGVFGTGRMPAPPDVIAAATLRMHREHPSSSWDLRDANGNEVPDGSYRIVVEVAEGNPEQVYEIPFEKRGQPFQLMPPDDGYLQDVKITME